MKTQLKKRIDSPTLPTPMPAEVRDMMAVAAGRRPADRIIRNVSRVNVHLPELEPDVSIALYKHWIAAIGPDLDHLVGESTEVIDGRGAIAVPGMIDAHTHLDSMFMVREFARLAIAGGNTTVVTESAMIAGAAGPAGVEAFMAETKGLPVRVLFLAPPLVPPFPRLETSAGFDMAAFRKALKRPDVIGVGETYWRPALDLPPKITRRLAAARKEGKNMEGHAAGARGFNLQAYRAGGITSCHESTTSKEALEKLRLGIAVQIREGYIRSELPAMAELAAMKDIDTRRLIIATDVAGSDMLLETGVMNELIRRAVKAGFDPLRAVQMLTLNPADYFGLSDLGRLDPGALADIVLLDDLKKLNIRMVFFGGRPAVRDGRTDVRMPAYSYPAALKRTIRLKALEAGDFRFQAPSGPVRVRAVAVLNETITREEIVETRAVRGRIGTDPARDLIKIAMFNKHKPKPEGTVGFARGFGLKSGALAASLNWDTNNIFIAGATDKEMAFAANRLIHNQGGLVVVKGRRVLAEMPMPVGGIISEATYEEVEAQRFAFEEAVRSLGSRLTRPFLTVQTFCFTGLPFIRLTDKGLIDIRKGDFTDVIVEDEA